MVHKNRRKGNKYERELVNDAKRVKLEAERAYGSDGRALGEAEGCDLIVAGDRVQAKRRKSVPMWLEIPEGVDSVAFRMDKGETMVLIEWDHYLELLGGEL